MNEMKNDIEPEVYGKAEVSTATRQTKKSGFGHKLLRAFVILIVISALGAVFDGVGSVIDETLPAKEFTAESKENAKAYVDVVMVVPTYSAYQYYGSKYAVERVSDDTPPDGLICGCVTNTDDVVWVKFTMDEYKNNIDETAEFKGIGFPAISDYEFAGKDAVEYAEPVRITGRVMMSEDISTASMRLDTDKYLSFLSISSTSE